MNFLQFHVSHFTHSDGPSVYGTERSSMGRAVTLNEELDSHLEFALSCVSYVFTLVLSLLL